MPRWLWWAPFALVTVICALIAFRTGWIAATLTETDMIGRVAERYVAEEGGDAEVTDCTAVPGTEPAVWLEVRCGAGRAYAVDRLGRLITPGPGPSRPQL